MNIESLVTNLMLGDCLERMRELPDNSVDSVVTDPPYGIRFMGKAWDGADIEKRAAARRANESHCPGSGPNGGHKSLAAEAGKYDLSPNGMLAFQEFSFEWAKEAYRVLKPGGHLLAFASCRTYHRMAVGVEMAGFEIRDQIQWLFGSGFPKSYNLKGEWQGWGTALKPANEPVVMARKPLEKGLTIAQNVLKWGTGALNIDGSRIATEEKLSFGSREIGDGTKYSPMPKDRQTPGIQNPQGRWPANIILDEEAAKALDKQSGALKSGQLKDSYITKESENISMSGKNYARSLGNRAADSGGASRFFYCAKTSKAERNAGLDGNTTKKTNDGRQKEIDNPFQRGSSERKNFHPTVKPTKLMGHLINMVTPPGGIVLDPFMGSGSTGVAAKKLGFSFIGIEMNDEYMEIAERRIAHVGCQAKTEDPQMEMSL